MEKQIDKESFLQSEKNGVDAVTGVSEAYLSGGDGDTISDDAVTEDEYAVTGGYDLDYDPDEDDRWEPECFHGYEGGCTDCGEYQDAVGAFPADEEELWRWQADGMMPWEVADDE